MASSPPPFKRRKKISKRHSWDIPAQQKRSHTFFPSIGGAWGNAAAPLPPFVVPPPEELLLQVANPALNLHPAGLYGFPPILPPATTVLGPSLVLSSPADSSVARSRLPVLENDTASDHQQDGGPETEQTLAEQSKVLAFKKNSINIYLTSSGERLVHDTELIGNNRLRVLLSFILQNDLDDYEQSRVALELVHTVQVYWKGRFFMPNKSGSQLVELDEDDSYDCVLQLLCQKDYAKFIFPTYASSFTHDNMAQEKPADVGPDNMKAVKKVRYTIHEDTTQEKAAALQTKVRRSTFAEARCCLKPAAVDEIHSEESPRLAASAIAEDIVALPVPIFQPPGMDKDKLKKLRGAAVGDLKNRQQRDYILEKVSWNYNKGPPHRPIAPSPFSSSAAASREVHAMEALCSLVNTGAVPCKATESRVVVPKKNAKVTNTRDILKRPSVPVKQQQYGRPSLEVAWNKMFDRLCQYKLKYGDCSVPYSWEQDRKLGDWVSVQRTRYKKGILSQQRVEKLNGIGFVWALRHPEAWDSMFERLVQFKQQHGHLMVPKDYQSYPKLGRWVAIQRSLMRKGKLTKGRGGKLESIGFVSTACLQKIGADKQEQYMVNLVVSRQHKAAQPSPTSVREVVEEEDL